MPLILAIEPDRHQAAQIAAIAQGRIGAELVLADSAERALRALGDRIPDLILTPQLLSPRDDEAITDRLRALGNAATFVQTLTIPALATAEPGTAARSRGLLSALRRQKASAPASNGCAPDVFAEQITVYLERALEARKAYGGADVVGVAPGVVDDVASGFSRKEDVVDVASGVVDDVASGFSRKEDVVDVASAPIWKEPLPELEPEWSATPVADAPAPAVDFSELWQPAIAETPIEERVPQPDVQPPVLLEPDHGPANEMDLAAVVDVAPPTAEDESDRQWPAQSDVTPVEEDIPIELVAAVESVAPVDIVAAVEDAAPTTESEKHREEPVVPQLTRVDDGEPSLVARFLARIKPVPAPTVTVAETSFPPAPKAVDAPESVEPADRGPADAAQVSDTPPPAAARPKAAKPASRKRRARPAPKDDWHFFDPEETRFAALLAKLDEITASDAARHLLRPES